MKMHSMNSVRDQISRKPDMSALPEKLDVMLPADPIFNDRVAYKGATRDGNADNLLRTYVECRNGFLCEGWSSSIIVKWCCGCSCRGMPRISCLMQ